MHPKNLRSFLADGIPSIMPQAQRLIKLRQVIAGLLPDNLRRSSSIANFKQGKVVIFAENSAVAAKLKLLAPALQGDLVKSGLKVTAIGVEVQPANRQSHKPTKRSALTHEAHDHLTALSLQLPDSELKNAVLAIAKHADSEH